ncbi:hypothetical protein [Nostoc sp. JL31]|uniref:hypothetical protein n=1 Tax=Nostoc sp. JL31 TaxID=2815395 RepID=UPI0025CE1E53|nr:hypothetical protein [Nostoc sp. JL31]
MVSACLVSTQSNTYISVLSAELGVRSVIIAFFTQHSPGFLTTPLKGCASAGEK